MENQHQLIKGYQDFGQSTVDKINAIKEIEQGLANMLEDEAKKLDGNQAAARHLAMARSDLETGFMYWIKSVARPAGGMANADLRGDKK